MALLGALLLVFQLLVRPQEFVPELHAYGLLNAAAALGVLGIVVETALGKQALPWTPQMPWLGVLVAWCFLVTVRQLGLEGLSVVWEFVGLSAIAMLVVAFAVRTAARWYTIVAALVAIGLAIAGTCIHQGHQQAECIVIDTSTGGDRAGEGVPDGRHCEDSYTCERQGKANTTYACEKVGLFGTFTEGARVRWRGTLGDPNELALALGATMPFCFAFSSAKKNGGVSLLCALAVAVALWCVVLTRSRGGQLIVLTVFGGYFVHRYATKGFLLAAMLALPVLLLGGRAGEEAQSSSLERVDLLYDGMAMVRAHPLLGVGTGQFMNHTWNGLTAHNSYVLTAAELGLPGSLFWLMLVYTSIKIPWVVATRPPPGLDSAIVAFALALVVSFAGILVGAFFLSFSYKSVLFIFFGLAGAMYGVVKRASPSFEVRVALKEVALVAVADAALLALVLVYSHFAEAHA